MYGTTECFLTLEKLQETSLPYPMISSGEQNTKEKFCI